MMAQAIWTTNFALYLTPIKSSAMPIMYKVRTAQYKNNNSGILQSMALINPPYHDIISMPMANAMEKNMTGLNAMPPNLGTRLWCIFRSSGTSKSFFLNEISNILGIITPLNIIEHAITTIMFIIQNIDMI